MIVDVGTRIGAYDIIGPLGQGGMGLVYRARDTKLNRDVALKVLPSEFALDAERLARFKREAQVLASLDHPNIGAIYGFEDAEGIHALVLQLVEGPTLDDRITQGPIPLDEALPIARQIADALEAAHEQGIIHRDLKPANVKVTQDGKVKVLDFGLAKLMDAPANAGSHTGEVRGVRLQPELTNSPTITTPAMTIAGVILGTAPYMSPEQAKGRPADKRSDIWAFGCVLYEMLTGTRAFEGEDVSDTLATVLKSDPDWSALPADTPSTIRTLLARCLKKDLKRRLPDIGSARLEIEETRVGATTDDALRAIAPAQTRWRRATPWVVSAALAAGLLATVVAWAPWKHDARAPMRLDLALGVDASLVVDQGPAMAFSPDGSTLAYVAEKGEAGDAQLYVRRLDQLEATLLSGTTGARNPFFSPDGQWIAFFANGKLKKAAVTGGSVVTLCDAPSGRGGSWMPDDTIAFLPVSASRPGAGGGIMRVPSAGGQTVPLTKLGPDELTERWPQVLPGGKAILYTVTSADRVATGSSAYENADIVVQPLPADGTRKIIQRSAFYGRYLPSGHLAYVHDGTLFAAPFDVRKLEVTGTPVPVIAGVMTSGGQGSAQLAISDAGTLVYVLGQQSSNAAPISWIDRNGTVSLLRATPSVWSYPQFSPDGSQLALNIRVGDGGENDVWIYEWRRDALSRLTPSPGGTAPVWTPDGRRITFASTAGNSAFNLYWQRADGSGTPERLTTSVNNQVISSWHPSGRFLAFQENTLPPNFTDVMVLPVEGDEASGWKPGKPTAFLSTPAREEEPAFSPDGRWLAYSSDKSGQFEVYVRPFQHPGGESLISIGGGRTPMWSRPRHEIFYLQPSGRIASVAYTVEGDRLRADKPKVRSETRLATASRNASLSIGAAGRQPFRDFAVHPDGDRLVAYLLPTGNQHRDRIVLVSNFFDELRRIAPQRK